MTEDRHLAIDELGDVDRSPVDDPRRRHLDTCPSCRASMLAYRRFLAEPTDLPAVDLAAARRRLRTARADRRSPLPTPETGRARRRPRLAPWGGAFPWRAALGAAAVGLALAAAYVGHDPRHRSGGENSLRGSGNETPIVSPYPAEVDQEGRVVLRWPRVATAERYRVIVHAQDLTPLATHLVEGDTLLVVPISTLGDGGVSGSTLYWQVTALRSGSVVATSQPIPFRIP